ncbi:ferredoxin [Leptolyngbya valderiana BDU 20041]|nr:ferredoxin [Geitlerinema sp. CS-897]OAB55981.1 ferredoxin [Leptolyngbya valderiana BDU 20041]
MARAVYVDKEDCTSCMQCASSLPEVFQMDDENLAEVHDSTGADEDDIQNEIDSCPGMCIHWKD